MSAERGEPSQAAMERARDMVHALGLDQCWALTESERKRFKDGDTPNCLRLARELALALDLHAAAAVQEERAARLNAEDILRQVTEERAAVIKSSVEQAVQEERRARWERVRQLEDALISVIGQLTHAWPGIHLGQEAARELERIAEVAVSAVKSGSAGDGEGKAQNPNPSQQPTTGTGGDDV